MLGNLTIEEPNLTAGLEYQRDQEPKAVHNHFQVNYKYRRYWSHNVVLDEENIIFEVRECPDCRVEIEHDERGHPYCLKCGSIFPLPRIFRKMDKQRAFELRKFIQELKHHGDRRAGEPSGAEAIREADHIIRPGARAKAHRHMRD